MTRDTFKAKGVDPEAAAADWRRAAEGYGETAVDPVEILRKFSTWNVLYHTPTQTQYAMRQLILALVETTKDKCPELAKAVIYQMPYGEADE